MDVELFCMADYEAAASLWQETEGIGVDDADSPGKIRFYLERNPGTSFVARRGKKLVGTALSGHDGRRGYLHHLAVRPECRRQGVARELIERCLAALAAAGIDRCNLFVYSDNVEGRKFWERSGWQLYPGLELFYREL